MSYNAPLKILHLIRVPFFIFRAHVLIGVGRPARLRSTCSGLLAFTVKALLNPREAYLISGLINGGLNREGGGGGLISNLKHVVFVLK